MNTGDLFAKLFVTSRYFTIGIRRRQENSVLEDQTFAPEFVVPAVREKWTADPILVDDGENTWLFYEAVVHDHGHIEVARVREDCTLEEPMVLLQDSCHYSYPFVFSFENDWYMIPESSAASEIRLYRAVRFPEKWEPVTVLLRERAVDTTVFEREGQLYLLTYLPERATERVTPRAFRLNLRTNNPALTPIPWEQFDSLQVRGAGPVFAEGESLFRPAQISREQRYGDGVEFFRIRNADGYGEEPVCRMGPEHLRVRGILADGLHTYCRSARFEAVDIRTGDVDFAKPLKKLFRK